MLSSKEKVMKNIKWDLLLNALLAVIGVSLLSSSVTYISYFFYYAVDDLTSVIGPKLMSTYFLVGFSVLAALIVFVLRALLRKKRLTIASVVLNLVVALLLLIMSFVCLGLAVSIETFVLFFVFLVPILAIDLPDFWLPLLKRTNKSVEPVEQPLEVEEQEMNNSDSEEK